MISGTKSIEDHDDRGREVVDRESLVEENKGLIGKANYFYDNISESGSRWLLL